MKSVKRKETVRRMALFIENYVSFFLLIAFVTTCSFLLFLWSMNLSEAEIRQNAPITFLNILFLSFLFTVIDTVRRQWTVKRPMKRILKATQQIAQGNFNIDLQPIYGENSFNEFDIIIKNLNQMAKELSGVETLRTDFVANVSHELKTPLSVIQNYGTILQNPNLTLEERTEYAAEITKASYRLSDLITNILRLNRLENQQIFPKSQEFNLSEQLCECLLNFENIWEEKSLNIETDIDEDIMLTADAELLSLVWNNLFSNAMKFTEKNGTVSVSLKTENGFAIVSVRDTGCGISPEVGTHIFEKFYQGDTSHATQGNGLGLALVRKIMDIVGGEISVQSIYGKGSTFAVRLYLSDKGGTL